MVKANNAEKAPLAIRADEVYSQDAVQQILGLNDWNLRQAKAGGELKFFRHGKTHVFSGSAILEWVKRNEKPGGKESDK